MPKPPSRKSPTARARKATPARPPQAEQPAAPARGRRREPPAASPPPPAPAPVPRARPPRRPARPAADDATVQLARAQDIRARIAGLEQELSLVTGVRPETEPAAEPAAAGDATVVPPAAASATAIWDRNLGPFDAPRESQSSDYFIRQWGRLGVRQRSHGQDEFGLDPETERRLAPVLELALRRYFRTTIEGIDNIPSEGRCLVVANHAGGPVPYDGLLLRTAVRHEHPAGRDLRWLSEDFFHHLPFVGPFMTRLGAVRACQENAQRLLRQETVVAVFPEGLMGVSKPYRRRYRLERFGRGGYVRLCLRTRTPLVPCAIVGTEDANPILHRMEALTRFLGVPYLPLTPTFPLLGPLGLLPAPAKLTLRFGEAISFDEHDPETADDEVLVGRLSDRIRGLIQAMLDDIVSKRRSVLFG
jgi:1-acyl-sn-glycerol-3-phosphate acyltransferase